MKFSKEEIRFWMQTAAEINGYRVGKRQNGRLVIYKMPENGVVTPKDVIITEAQFVKDMERKWH